MQRGSAVTGLPPGAGSRANRPSGDGGRRTVARGPSSVLQAPSPRPRIWRASLAEAFMARLGSAVPPSDWARRAA
eukprot:1292416-Alexandrium_andersonii.AAC.1